MFKSYSEFFYFMAGLLLVTIAVDCVAGFFVCVGLGYFEFLLNIVITLAMCLIGLGVLGSIGKRKGWIK